MGEQRMTAMLRDAKEAVQNCGFSPDDSKDLMGHLVLASAIEISGGAVSMSLDKLSDVATQIGNISNAIGRHP